MKEGKRNKKTIKGADNVIHLSNSDISFNCIYPDENPNESIENITMTLNHIGIFEGISKEK